MDVSTDYGAMCFRDLLKEYLVCHKYSFFRSAYARAEKIKQKLCDADSTTHKKDLQEFLHSASDLKDKEALQKILYEISDITKDRS